MTNIISGTSVFTENEIDNLILSFAQHPDQKNGFTEDDMAPLFKWAREVKINYAILQCVIKNSVLTSIVNGEVKFTAKENITGM